MQPEILSKMRCATASLSLLFLLVGCTSETSRQSADLKRQDSTVTRTSSTDSSPPMDWADSIQAVEVAGIRASAGKVARVGSILRIELLNGKSVTFVDDSTPGAKSNIHRYAGYQRQLRSHVVHVEPYEGAQPYLVVDDSTGDSTVVWGMPVPSPDSIRFVAASMANSTDGEPGMIEIWRMVGRKPEKEFSYTTEHDSWEPSNPVWRDTATIEFSKNTRSGCCESSKTPGWVIRNQGTWSLANARH